MGLRPGKPVKNRIALRHVVDSPATPRSASQQTQHGKQTTFECAISLQCFNGIIRATGVIPTTRRRIRGDTALIPAHPANQHRLERSIHRKAALRAMASNNDAICRSNAAKSAHAAVGLARRTMSQQFGNTCSYCLANTRKRRFTALRTTALPTDLETANPKRRASVRSC